MVTASRQKKILWRHLLAPVKAMVLAAMLVVFSGMGQPGQADTTPPTVTITAPASHDGARFWITLNFSEETTGFDQYSELLIQNGTLAASSSGNTYMIKPSGTGDVTIQIPANSFTDFSGNGNPAAGPVTVSYVARPFFTGRRLGPNSVLGTIAPNATKTIYFSASKSLSGFTVDDIVVTNGTAVSLVNNGTSWTGLVDYTLTVRADGTGNVTVSIPENVATDADGNGNLPATFGTFTLDTTAPTVTISNLPALATRLPFSVTVTFSETVTGFSPWAGDLVVGNGRAGSSWNKGNGVYQVEINPDGMGDVTISVPANVATDTAGNGNVASNTVTIPFSPRPAMSAGDGEGSIIRDTNLGVIAPGKQKSLSIIVSRPVTGFTADKVTVTNGSVVSLSKSMNTSFGGEVYNLTVQADGGGDVTISVAENVVTDADGNGNLPATIGTFTLDATPPQITAIHAPTTTGSNTFTIIYEVSERYNFDEDSVTVTNGRIDDFDDRRDRLVLIIRATAAGAVSVTLQNNAVTDYAGHALAQPVTVTVTYDPNQATGRPTAILKGPQTLTRVDPFWISVIFSERIGWIGPQHFKVVNGRILQTIGDDGTFQVQLSPSGEGDVEITLRENAVQDADGNGNLPATLTITCAVGCRDGVSPHKLRRSIRHFMGQRMLGITSHAVGFARAFSPGGIGGFSASAPVGFAMQGTLRQHTGSFSTSLNQVLAAQQKAKLALRQELSRKLKEKGGLSYEESQLLADSQTLLQLPFNVWAKGHWTRAWEDRADTSDQSLFALFYLGADYRLTDDFILGVMGQLDWSDNRSRIQGVHTKGRGWMAGGYAVMRLTPSVIADMRASWGKSLNRIEFDSAYTDKFDTTRWLLEGGVTGNFRHGNWRVSPGIRALYFEERQEAYTDSMGNRVEPQTDSLGSVSFGPEIGYRYMDKNGYLFEPNLALEGVWDFQAPDITDVNGVPIGREGLRARVKAGFLLRAPNGVTARGSYSYDGIGLSAFEAHSGEVTVNIPLN